ncbi:Extracellular metalloproteinase 10 [Grifola frondosa]|uniref:Extracellular metalloproteinase n=1 Tax=Grifola frondosa TaxID=5627 RepID=A0A1C7MLV8_GRIFR|nr:Extracellular metalloproteinase 10 [Grifola frondosa]
MRVRNIGRDFKIEAYHPESSYETFGTGIDHPLSKRVDASIEDSAIAFIQSHLGVDTDAVHVRSAFAGQAAQHVYVKQQINGVSVANAFANIAFNKDNKVVAFGSSFVKASKTPSATPSINIKDVISTAESVPGGKYDTENHPTLTLEYLVKDDGSVALTHVFQVGDEAAGTWYQAFVDAHSGGLVSIADFVTKSALTCPSDHKGGLDSSFETLTDLQGLGALPDGWRSDGTTSTTTTAASTAPNNNFGGGGSGNDRVKMSVQDSAGTDNADFLAPLMARADTCACSCGI